MRVDLPIVGKPFPRGRMRQIYSQRTCAQRSGNAGELTLAPKTRQHECRFASRGGTRCARNPHWREFGRARLEQRARHAAGGADAARRTTPADPGGATQQPLRASVDTCRPSDMVENRKTCGISIGSASSTPPVALAAETVRRPAKMASDDDYETSRGVRRWLPK